MSQAVLNRIWARSLLNQLAATGVKHICVAPGSRSTPLSLEALALAQQGLLQLHCHFDERGLGFLALGLAKSSGSPVAVIVTSGTAVANLLPAVAESGLTGESLILLTADRPAELVGVGANQAIVQAGIFSSHVCDSIKLPSPNDTLPFVQLQQRIAVGLRVQQQQGGSLHINCPYPEPLYWYDEQQQALYQDYLAQLSEPEVLQVDHRAGSAVAEITNEYQQQVFNQLSQQKGIIVLGKMTLAEAQHVQQLAQQLGWPLLADPQAGISSDWAHFDIWLQSEQYRQPLLQAQCVLQFGARIVSKRLLALIKQLAQQQQASYWLFDSSEQILNPDHLPQLRTVASIQASVMMLQAALPTAIDDSLQQSIRLWAEECSLGRHAVTQVAEQLWGGAQELTECQLAWRLGQLLSRLPQADVFIGNSLIVRLVDMFSVIDHRQVYTNRGASGIDGLVATAAGIQKASQQAMLMLIGDTSLLYDLNSLALLNPCQQPFVLLVTNNDGGAIFDLLPVPEQQKQALYQMPHGLQFQSAAQQFGLRYSQANQFEQCLASIEQYLADFANGEVKAALMLEVVTPAEQASRQIKQCVNAIIIQK